MNENLYILLYATDLCKFTQEGKLLCVALYQYFKYYHSLNATRLQGAQSLNLLYPKKITNCLVLSQVRSFLEFVVTVRLSGNQQRPQESNQKRM